MEKKFKLGVIGAGYMATSIIKGAIRSNFININDILVSDVLDSSLQRITDLRISVTKDNALLANSCEYILFAVKPQNFNDLALELKGTSCKKYISIMAGVKINRIKEKLGEVSVVRCMPNAPCQVGNGAVGIDLTDFNDQVDKDFALNLFSGCAEVIEVEENKLGAVTGISGSAPAYFYLFAKGLIEAGVQNGLTEEQAIKFVVNTMIGSGKMLFENKEKSIDELISSVCSKGGTTIEAIKVYTDRNLSELSHQAVNACIKRSNELENI